MTKGSLITSAFCMVVATPAMARTEMSLQPDTVLQSAALRAEQAAQKAEEDDASDFTFTESQLDEDMDAAQTISNISSTNNDPYLSQVGFLWSSVRFRVRAYDNMYSTTFLNGIEFNDLELGRYNYSLLGGLNDATRNKEGMAGFEANSYGVTGIAGGENINLRASQIAAGNKITLTACNRNYRYRTMYTFGTGIMNNGWAFAGSIGYRWAKEGNIEGTFYNSFSYFLAAQKLFNDQHSVSLVTFGAPTQRAQQGASTEEAYWLANSHYYNPNWGYQNGKKRNARVVNDYEPTTILTWDWKIDNTAKLSTSAAYKHANYSNSALGWAGEAYDPRPDYYKNLPSSIFNVYDTNPDGNGNNDKLYGDNAFLLTAYNSLKDQWDTKANRQINWDRMYYVNKLNGEALYYLERRHNDQRVWSLSSTYQKTLDGHNKIMGGVYYNHTLGLHYKTMDDLLGGTHYVDIDKFAAGDYGMNSIQAQPDIYHRLRSVKEGDKFGYDYNTIVNLEKVWAEYIYTSGSLSALLAGQITGTQMERDGKKHNGQGMVLQEDGKVVYDGQHYYDNSYGKSGVASFLGGGVKASASWAPTSNHRFTIGASWEKKAPLVRNAFVAPRVQNNYVNNLTLEDIYGADASYLFTFGPLSGKVAGYYTEFRNAVEQTAFFNDANSAFSYLTMSKVNRRHYGVEAALNMKLDFILENLSVHALGTYSEAEYTNNPFAQLTTEGMSNEALVKLNQWINPVTKKNMPLRVAAKGMKVSSTPLTALNVGVKYNKNYWFFEINANYFDRVYVGFSQYRRLTNIMGGYVREVDGEGNKVYPVSREELKDNGGVLFTDLGVVRKVYAPEQEKFEGGWLFDASVGKSIRLRHSKTMSINLQVQNIANNINLRTGGYEQNRDDAYYNTYGLGDGSKGLDKAYKFSKNAKYYYANPFNFFLNVNYRF